MSTLGQVCGALEWLGAVEDCSQVHCYKVQKLVELLMVGRVLQGCTGTQTVLNSCPHPSTACTTLSAPPQRFTPQRRSVTLEALFKFRRKKKTPDNQTTIAHPGINIMLHRC